MHSVYCTTLTLSLTLAVTLALNPNSNPNRNPLGSAVVCATLHAHQPAPQNYRITHLLHIAPEV